MAMRAKWQACMSVWTLKNSTEPLRYAVFIAALVPLAELFVRNLGANPVEYIMHSTGSWALRLLCLTLMMSPLFWVCRWGILIKLRRMLGLFCFFYACLHCVLWFWVEQELNLSDMMADIFDRPFITFGFLAFLSLVPLAVTSNLALQRLMGRRWLQLHRLVYATAVLTILHYWWDKSGKNDFDTVLIYTAVVVILLLIRLPPIKKYILIWGSSNGKA